MIFTSPAFYIFFSVLLFLLLIFKKQSHIKIIILLASYFFYGYWDYRFLLLIIISTGIDFYIGKKISKTDDSEKRKKLLIVSIASNLSILGFFKYYNFFILSANTAFSWTGFNFATLNIILPVGISFYTFQTMSYTIDIFRHKLQPCKSIIDFAIFVAFFPQLIAGPIVRAIDFLPQLKEKIILKKENVAIGLQIFLFGMIKKSLIADRLSIFVDKIFENPELFSTSTMWLAIIAYSIQIYADFSGYSDMAIGIAKILGFNLPNNFNMPYSAKNITEFWHRWHITLSTWLKDYLYIPLGGSHKGNVRTYINLFITMLLGGLWHGASWNFVIWGGLHGIGLSIHKLYLKVNLPKNIQKNKFYKTASWFLTYFFVLICWIFFRSTNFQESLIILHKIFSIDRLVEWNFTALFIIAPIIIWAHIYGYSKKHDYYPIFDLKTFQGAFILIFVILTIFFLKPLNTNPFIYFQF